MDDKNIDTSNIFDEFVNDESLKEDIRKAKNDRGILYYIELLSKFFKTIFLLGLIVGVIGYSYIYIQKNTEKLNLTFFDPICYIFIGNIDLELKGCVPITYLEKIYLDELITLKKEQSEKVLGILSALYKRDNFLKTKEVIFLLNKSSNKFKILSIMEEFDDLKINYNSTVKDQIECGGLTLIQADNSLSVVCEAFSSNFETQIKGFTTNERDFIKGSSISIANSFLNYIEKRSDFFEIVDKQKVFTSTSVLGNDTNFTQKTSFTIKLKYDL